MIKPVKIVNEIVGIVEKATPKAEEALKSAPEAVAEKLPQPNAELLQAYHKVKAGKLFDSFEEFATGVKTRLEGFSECLPEGLHKKLATAVEDNNFDLSKIVSDYYSGLNDCKTFDDVRKLYPNIELPKLNFEEEITKEIKCYVPQNDCKKVQTLKSEAEKRKYIDEMFDRIMSKQTETWEIKPELKKIKDNIANEIIEGTFEGTENKGNYFAYGNQKMPLRYRLLRTEDREQTVIQMLKEHYLNGKNTNEIVVKTTDGKDIYAHRLRHSCYFTPLDKEFRRFMKSVEEEANKFKNLSKLESSEINSAVFSQTWKSSLLRKDLGQATAYTKDWSIAKAVWQKSMYPETTFYPTDKMIDVYLLMMYKNGKRTLSTPNPILKYSETPFMDKTKISLLKRLYKSIKLLEDDKNILNSQGYKEFKAQFDENGMKESIEKIENHYKNTFFKYFWTDERKMRFKKALHENRELANQNVEISDNILNKAMENVFSE